MWDTASGYGQQYFVVVFYSGYINNKNKKN